VLYNLKEDFMNGKTFKERLEKEGCFYHVTLASGVKMSREVLANVEDAIRKNADRMDDQELDLPEDFVRSLFEN